MLNNSYLEKMTKTTPIVLPLSIFLTRKSEENLMVKLEWNSVLQINYSKMFYFSTYTESRTKAIIYPKINFWNYIVIFILYFQQSAGLANFIRGTTWVKSGKTGVLPSFCKIESGNSRWRPCSCHKVHIVRSPHVNTACQKECWNMQI